MTPERLEEIRVRVERLDRDNEQLRGSGFQFSDARAVDDRRDLLAEVDRLRAALTRIVDDPGDAHHHASRALEGTP